MIDFNMLNKLGILLLNTPIGEEYLDTIFKISWGDLINAENRAWFSKKYGKNKKVNFIEIANYLYKKANYLSYDACINKILERCEDQYSLCMFKILASGLEGYFGNINICDCENDVIALKDAGIYYIVKGNNKIMLSRKTITLVFLNANNELPNILEASSYKNFLAFYKSNLDIVKDKIDYNGNLIGNHRRDFISADKINSSKRTADYKHLPEELINNSVFMHWFNDYYGDRKKASLLNLCKVLKRENKYVLNYHVICAMLKEHRDDIDSFNECIDLLLDEECNYTGFGKIQHLAINNEAYKTFRNDIYLLEGNNNTIIINNNYVILLIVGKNNTVIVNKERNRGIIASKYSKNNKICVVKEEEKLIGEE